MDKRKQIDEGPDKASGPFPFSDRALAAVFVLIYTVAPGLPRLLLAPKLALLPAGWFNLEFLAIGAAALFLPRGFVFALLLAESLVDFIYAICSTYQFSASDLFAAFQSFATLPTHQRVQIFAAALLVPALCAAIAALPRPDERARRIWTAASLLTLATILLTIAIAGGQDRLRHHDSANSSRHVVRTPILSLWMRESFLRHVQASSREANGTPRPSASAQLGALTGSENPPNIVFVLVESWGLALDPALAQALTNPYQDPRIAARYQLSSGTVPFDSATISAEARELCHSHLGFGILHIAAPQAASCLPAELHARGYQALSVHGYSGRMFQRSSWYRILGFDQSWFGADLDQAGLPRCAGAFTGTCDASIAGWIGTNFLTPGHPEPRFIYWVTLNSHLPVPTIPDLPADSLCATLPQTRASPPLCSWARLERNVHVAVQQLALSHLARPTIFVLVGDHAPPFANPELRAHFSSSKVPYLVLVPR